MKGILLLASILPALLSAKGDMVKIAIQGPGLAEPVEITDSGIRDFSVWAGPGIRINGVEQTEGFIIDWAQGPVAEPVAEAPSYEVSFYSRGHVNGLVYAVSYVFDAKADQGFVYLPGKGDERYPLNAATMYHGHRLEGNWFRATRAWESFARPCIAKARVTEQSR